MSEETGTGIEAGETKIEGITRDYWNSKSGGYAKKDDQVKGVLLRMEADEYKGKPTQQYVLKSSADGHEIYLPGHAVLNGMMAQVKVGRTVRVVYLGKGEGRRGRNAPELYDVFMTADPIQEVAKQPEKKPQGSIRDSGMADYMKEILTELTFGMKFFSEGLIPDSSVQETIRAACRKYRMNDPTTPQMIMRALLAEGLIFEPKPSFYKVVV